MLRTRRFRREFGMRAHFALRKMPEPEAYYCAEMPEHHPHRRKSLPARRTFEVSIVDHGDRGRVRTREVIAVVYRDCEHARLVRLLIAY